MQLWTEHVLQCNSTMYRVFHLLRDLGWVELDFDVPLCYLATQPLLPNSHQPKQNQADSGTLKIQVNSAQNTSTSRWDTLYKSGTWTTTGSLTFFCFGVRGRPYMTSATFLGLWTPSPPCPHLGLIYSTKFMQPPLLHLLLG